MNESNRQGGGQKGKGQEKEVPRGHSASHCYSHYGKDRLEKKSEKKVGRTEQRENISQGQTEKDREADWGEEINKSDKQFVKEVRKEGNQGQMGATFPTVTASTDNIMNEFVHG